MKKNHCGRYTFIMDIICICWLDLCGHDQIPTKPNHIFASFGKSLEICFHSLKLQFSKMINLK